MICVIGYAHAGKSTLLNVLGEALAPMEGKLFVSSHLSKLHYTNTPVLMDTSIAQNLRYGDKKSTLEEMKLLLKKLRMSEIALGHLEDETWHVGK